MKSIKEKAKEHGLEYPGIRCSNDDIYKDCDKPSMDFEAGANYVVEQIENFMKGLDLGDSAKEKFYKFDILADIHGFIEQLKK